MKQTPVQFFFEHAGWSYAPDKETKLQGRWRCARALANAEREASNAGLSFEWDLDGMDSSEWLGKKQRKPWPTWVCVCRDGAGTVLSSLCGIDFGRDGKPWGDPYRRVVEAELALEAL